MKNPSLANRLSALFLLVGVLSCMVVTPLFAQSTVYLVRHAEKQPGHDPELTNDGKSRAQALMRMLGAAGIEHIYSTDTKRTLQTAAPLAAHCDLEVKIYDYKELAALAETIRTNPGTYLVVGHSNTTPEMVAALGGIPGTPISESEYDRLYQVIIDDDNATTTLFHMP